MAKQRYRVTKHGLNIADGKGDIRQLEVGEEFSHDDLPDFWLSKVEVVNASEKEFEVATPAKAATKK